MADTLSEAEEYVAKFAVDVTDTEERKGSASGRTPASRESTSSTMKSNLERLPLPSFDRNKKHYLIFKKELSNNGKLSRKLNIRAWAVWYLRVLYC